MQPPTQCTDLAGHFLQRIGILLFDCQLQKNPRLLQIFFQAVKGVDPKPQERPLL